MTPARLLLSVCALQFAALSAASAAVTTLGTWRLGEDDAGAVNGGAGNATTTGINGGNALTAVNSTIYTSSVTAPGASTLAMQFTGDDVYTGSSVAPLTDNVGMEIWVRPTSIDGFDFAIANGRAGNGGFGIVQIGGFWSIIHSGVQQGTNGAAVQLNTWQHLAYVRSGGVSTLYVNGVASGGTIALAPTVPNTFVIGGNLVTPGPEGQFNGQLDNARLFTFAPGAFSVSDLNYPAIVPEPSAALLSGLAGLALLRRRR